MRCPCLVLKRLCKTDIHVHLESEDTDNHGGPEKVLDLKLKCNFRDRAKTILTAEKKLVQITGAVLFPEDIAPDLPTLGGGTVTVSGEERRIEQGIKARNLDGTVNYCQLEVVRYRLNQL